MNMCHRYHINVNDNTGSCQLYVISMDSFFSNTFRYRIQWYTQQQSINTNEENMSAFKKQQVVLAEANSLFVKRSAIMDRLITYCGAGHVDYVNKCFNAEVNGRVSTVTVKQEAIMHIIFG